MVWVDHHGRDNLSVPESVFGFVILGSVCFPFLSIWRVKEGAGV